MRTLSGAIAFGQLARDYIYHRHGMQFRAIDAFNFSKMQDQGSTDATSMREFLCKHEWAYTGGDEGHGRCYCIFCGKDGDG